MEILLCIHHPSIIVRPALGIEPAPPTHAQFFCFACLAVNIYQLEEPEDNGDDSTGSEQEKNTKPVQTRGRSNTSMSQAPPPVLDLQLRLINSWHLEGVKKIKFNRGLVFCLTNQLEAWHMWVTRVSVRHPSTHLSRSFLFPFAFSLYALLQNCGHR